MAEHLADPSGPRLRLRALVVGALAVALIASAFVLDRGSASRASSPPGLQDAGTRSGAWFCPHGGGEDRHGWVIVANPGPAAVSVRITSFGKEGADVVGTFDVQPSTETEREVPATDAGAATAVEYFGGWVGAEAVVASESALASERCLAAPRSRWYAMDTTTSSEETATLVVMNPFSQVAEFDVVFRTDAREVAPGPLSPVVLPPRSSAGVRVNDYLLLAADEHAVAAEVDVKVGRVILGAVVASPNQLRMEGAMEPQEQWVLPLAGATSSGRLVVFNPTSGRADLSVLSSDPSGRRALLAEGSLSLGPEEVRSLDLTELPSSGAVLVTATGRPVVAALRATAPAGDVAMISGATRPRVRWLVFSGLPPTGGRTFVIVQNPGRTPVRVTLAWIGTKGSTVPPAPKPVTVPAEETVQIAMPLRPKPPLAVVVSALGGTIVAGSSSYGLAGVGYASTLGVPMM